MVEGATASLGDLYYPLVAGYQVVLAVLVLSAGRPNALRAGFAILLGISAVETMQVRAVVQGSNLDAALGIPISGAWMTVLDGVLLGSAAFLLTQFPVPWGGPGRSRAVAGAFLAGIGGWVAAASAVILTRSPWSFVVFEVHDFVLALSGAVLALHTVPRLLALRPGPLRLRGALVTAGIGVAFFETTGFLGALVLSRVPRYVYDLRFVFSPAGFILAMLVLAIAVAIVLARHTARTGERYALALLAGLALAFAVGVLGFVLPAGSEFERRVPAELIAQAFRPMLLGVAILRFELFRVPAWMRRRLLPATAAMLLLSLFVLANATITGAGLGSTTLDPLVVLATLLLFAAGIVAYREPLAASFLPPPGDAERARRRERLQSYQLALEQARAAPGGGDPVELEQVRARLGVTAAEHDALAAVLQGHVVIPEAALLGAHEGDVVQGRYRVVRELGRGGQGRVLLAHDTRRGEDVVLKEALRPWEEGAGERRAALSREARALARVESPHVARVHGLVEDDWQHYLVRAFVPGRTLAEVVEQRGPLPPAEARRVIGDVLTGLEALHAAGLLHLDVKPQNIVLRADGRAVLIDAGAVRADGAAQVRDPDTTRNPDDPPALVTLRWAAPEMLRGERPTPRTDVHQAGSLLFFLLTGRPPVEGEVAYALERAIVEGRPLPWGAATDSTLRAVAQRARARDPLERYADARAMHDAIAGTLPSGNEKPAPPYHGPAR